VAAHPGGKVHALAGCPADGVVRTRARMSTPPAFTAEQVALLQAAFEHVWSRMSRLQGDLNDNASNVATLLSLLVERGLLTPEQFEAAVEELTATAGLESGMRNLAKPRVTDASLSADILNGDVEAFRRRALAEEDDD